MKAKTPHISLLPICSIRKCQHPKSYSISFIFSKLFPVTYFLHNAAHSMVLPPVTLIVCDSVVRNVKSKTAVSMCYLGAEVSELVCVISSLLTEHPSLKKVVVHGGTNDSGWYRSEVMKRDFTGLLKASGKNILISGPISSLEDECFSRRLTLHEWFQA